MAQRKIIAGLAIAAAIALISGCSSNAEPAPAPTTKAASDPALDKLIKAAQEEGEFTFYTVPPEPVAQALADKFKEKYNISAKFVRGTSSQVSTRVSAEVTAGNLAADMILISNSKFVGDAVENGWMTTPADSDIPGFPWKFPKESIDDEGNVTVQYAPSGLSFNTDLVKDKPKDWKALLDPEFKGKVILQDPAASPASIDFWYVIQKKYGMDFLKKLAPQVERFYPSVVPLTEALAAGEGALAAPNVGAAVAPAQEKGAPVDVIYPDVTTGPEIVPLLSVKAEHPNAAKLFTMFVMSEEGNKILNSTPGVVSPYDTDNLPKEFARVNPADSQPMKDEIVAALTGK